MKPTEEQLNYLKEELYLKVPILARKAAPIFKQLNLTWGKNVNLETGTYEQYIPNEEDIALVLLGLIDDLDTDEVCFVETGRLRAEWEWDGFDSFDASISFILSEDVYGD